MRARAGLLTAAVASAAVLAGGAPAQAADSYRYWSFWEAEGSGWSYASQGPATAKPDDGAVIGFRFAVSEDSGDAASPRPRTEFAKVCGDTSKGDGKRVALALDFGNGADAPAGEHPPKPRTECAQVPEDASAAEALAAVAEPLRYDSDSMLCAVEGYPAKGCGEQVSGDGDGKGGAADSDSADSAGKEDDGGLSSGAGIAAGAAAVVILGGAAAWQARRRRS